MRQSTYNKSGPGRCANTTIRDLDTTQPWELVMPYPNLIHIPPSRAHERVDCGDRSPAGRRCNRPDGHTGRHNFSWRHLDGRVREVWGG